MLPIRQYRQAAIGSMAAIRMSAVPARLNVRGDRRDLLGRRCLHFGQPPGRGALTRHAERRTKPASTAVSRTMRRTVYALATLAGSGDAGMGAQADPVVRVEEPHHVEHGAAGPGEGG